MSSKIVAPAAPRTAMFYAVAGVLLFQTPTNAADTHRVGPQTPIKLAMFDFELEDTSAGPGESPADTHLLERITADARNLIVGSNRYTLVNTLRADAPAAKGRWLHQCHGCDAAIALELGASQSLLGYVTRISRTEYMVRILITDAKTSNVVSDFRTGLRMGADYSWDRGVKSLIDNQVLKGSRQ